MERRTFLRGLGAALITAPAIVRVGSLMPVKVMLDDGIALASSAHPTSLYPTSLYIGDVVFNPDGSIRGIWDGWRVLTRPDTPLCADGEAWVDTMVEAVIDVTRHQPNGLRILSRE